MRCLLCNKNYEEDGNLYEVLFHDDLICEVCRKKWIKSQNKIYLNNHLVKSLWLYNDAFKEAILQYKECYDEALKDIFLYPVKNKLKKEFKGYTLLLMPSSKKKEEERGFNHLEEMFSCLNIEMLSPFKKIEDNDQKGKTQKQRERMIDNITLKEDKELPYKIVLVDDILTTGSTMLGAMKYIDFNKHKVKLYTIATARKVE